MGARIALLAALSLLVGCPQPTARITIHNETSAVIVGVYFVRDTDNTVGEENEIGVPITPGGKRTVVFPVAESCNVLIAAVEYDRDLRCSVNGAEEFINGKVFALGEACPGDAYRWFVREGGFCAE